MSEENQTQNQEEQINQTPEPVAYKKEFVDKILTEKKNYAKMVTELTTKVKEFEEAVHKAKDDQKAIAEMKTKEAEEWKSKFLDTQNKIQTAAKISAVKKEFEKMGLKDSKAIESIVSLVKVDAIKFDEDNQVVLGAEDEAKRIKESLPMVFSPAAPKMNHDAGGGAPVEVSVEAYQKLVLSPEWRKMSRQQQDEYTAKVSQSLGMAVRK